MTGIDWVAQHEVLPSFIASSATLVLNAGGYFDLKDRIGVLFFDLSCNLTYCPNFRVHYFHEFYVFEYSKKFVAAQ